MVVSRFTYTLETIIQAGKTLVAVDHVPIRTNEKTRESRLFPSMWSYVRRNAVVDLPRLRAVRAAARVHDRRGHRGRCPAAVIWARFIYFFLIGEGQGHVQSLILGSTLLIIAVIFVALGVIGDLLAASPLDAAAHAGARAPRGAEPGRRALALRARRRPRHGHHRRRLGHGATGKREEVRL